MSRRARQTTFIPGLIVILALFSLFAGCKTSSDPQSNRNALPAVVATVDGRPIPAKLFEMYLRNGQEELGLNPSTDEGRRKLELLREGVVSELIDRALIAQEAERRGLGVSSAELREAEGRAVAQFGGEKQYDEYLARHHLSREEYGEVLRSEIFGAKLREDFMKKISVTDEEVKKYYDEHKGDAALQLPERVTASHILIIARPAQIRQQLQRDKNLTGDALEKGVRDELRGLRARAEELRRRVAAGADFATLAREASEDPASRERGGELGTFTRNSHPKAFDDAAFNLQPGAISPVVETEYGFHIIKVRAHEQPRRQTFDEAAPEIRRRMTGQRLAVDLKEWLRQARRRATVRISEPFRFGSLKDEFPAM